MFYSNEVLTSRKYGVATVWLVATLGTGSGLKKVGRKAILDVNVSKACSTVLAPEAPMALRLQSNLLFGIARVYAQQCGYVLSDTEAIRNSMRAMLKQKHQANLLQPEGQTRAKPDLLQDDPAFMPGLDFMNIDLDNLNFRNLNLDSTTLHDDSQSNLSPHSSQLTNASQKSIGGLMLPPSASSFPGGPVGGSDLFGIRGHSELGTAVQPARLLEDDLFVVGDDGTMNIDDIPIHQSSAGAKQTQPSATKDRASDIADVVMSDQALDDEFFPAQGNLELERPEGELQHETSSETATAPLRQRRVQKVNIVPLDHKTELSNRELAERNKSYMDDMRAASHQKQSTKLANIAKKNAEYWVLGGSNMLGQDKPGPLDMFSGTRLYEAFTGIKLGSGGQKRAREDGDTSTELDRRVRARGEGDVTVDEIGRGLSDDNNNNFLVDDDYTIEQGREAPTPLDERQASSIFPWNQSAASRRPTDAHATSASMGGATQLDKAVRRASRLTSASPLTGRGMHVAEPDEFQLGLESDYAEGMMTGNEEFELFGAAAHVDTQTAAQSQWQRATLVGESANFLDFVTTAIDNGNEVDADGKGVVEFETLLPPHQSQIVAAQAFLHLLTLGTRGNITVVQNEPFGAISMKV